ncbi:ATP-binding protein [Nocardioides marmoriginsengisoli]|uniref:ATP-binding protein n=1 Tax=Nocardioides marmoriginsengisoli TaxID=661483 RepID=UPI00161856F7|nr:LuxR family transcriptional regulator [Nocardioides marmoriginsengisoli]
MRPPLSASASRTLVERDLELGLLDGILTAAVGGRGGSARVLGPAGVGKTSLVRALGEHARDAGARSWLTSAGQLEARVPFGVVRRLLDEPVRAVTPEHRQALAAGPARLALHELWGGGGARAEPPAQGDMVHSLGWLLTDLVASGPVLLGVDDAQWADEESLLFLGSLRDRLPGLPVALVVSARDESVDRTPAMSALVADRDAVVLRLGPLSAAGVDAVLVQAWGSVPDGAAAAVLDVTGGNPFLVHALAGALADAPVVGADQVRAAVPASVVDLMVARLTGLSAAEQALARAIAVLDDTALPVAAALADDDVDAETADRLRRAGLLAEDGGLRFRHALLRSAVYAVIGPDVRDELHRRAARILAAQPGPDLSAAAAHLLASSGVGDPWAVGVLRQAAAAAIGVGAPQSAMALLQRAVAEPPPEDDLAEVLHELGLAQLRAFDPGCAQTLARAHALTPDPVLRALRALPLAAAYGFGGRHVDAADLLGSTLDEVRGGDRELELTLVATWAAVALLVPDRVAGARERLAEVADLPGATPAERLVLIQQVFVAASANEPAAKIGDLIGRVIGDGTASEQSMESGAWVWPRLFLGRIGEYDEVRRQTDTGLALAEANGSVAGMIAAHFVRALAEADAGRLPEAEQHFQAMLAHHDGGLLIQMLGHSGLAQTLARQGRVAEARAILDRFPAELDPATPVTGAALVWDARSQVCRAEGDDAGALAAAERLHALLGALGADSPTWVPWRPVAIDALRSLDRLPEARTLAEEHLAACEASGVRHLVGEAFCLLGSVTADPAEGIALARRGVEVLAESGSGLRAGAGELTLGALLRRDGAKAAAREHLRTAADLLDGAGAVPLADYARAELAATGVRLSRSDPRTLTPSERRVVELALAGSGNREIAARLHVTRKTVETHLSAAYRKLGIRSRDELTAGHLEPR